MANTGFEERAWQHRGGNYRGQRDDDYAWDQLPPGVPQAVLDELRTARAAARGNLDPTLTHFPAEPKVERIWITWAFHLKHKADGTWKVGKVPYQASPARDHARSNDPATWRTLEEAQRAYGDGDGFYSGIGFAFAGTKMSGADYDHVLDPDGLLSWAEEVMNEFPPTYSEYSVRGGGLHTLGLGGYEGAPVKKEFADGSGFELFSRRVPGFFYVTGKPFLNAPSILAEVDWQDIHDRFERGELGPEDHREAQAGSRTGKGDGQATATDELQAVIAAVKARGITLRRDRQEGNKYYLSQCLFNPCHSGGTSVAIIVHLGGVCTYHCKHRPGCEDEKGNRVWTWGDVLRLLGLAVKKAVAGFELTKLGDLMKKEFPPDKYLWEDRLVVGTVSIVVAKPKVGKSTFGRNFALAVARGLALLGWKTLKGLVIYIALEERAQEMQEELRLMGAQADGDEELYIHAAPNPAEALLSLTALIREHKPALVVIDPLFRFTKVKDEKAYAEVYSALGPLVDLARETGTHFMLMHHGSKVPKNDPIDSPLGSTGLGGAPATLIVLSRFGKYRTICTVQRTGKDIPETVLLLDDASHKLTLGRTKEGIEQHDAEQRILAFLEGREPQTQTQIKDGVEGRTKVIWTALIELVKTGRVDKAGEGRRGKPFLYGLPGSAGPHRGNKEQETLII